MGATREYDGHEEIAVMLKKYIRNFFNCIQMQLETEQAVGSIKAKKRGEFLK